MGSLRRSAVCIISSWAARGALAVGLGIILSSCGGGGGGTGSPPPVTAATLVITTHPQAQSASVGATATFTVGVTGTAVRYQWQLNGAPIPGATSSSYSTSALHIADSGARYSVLVSDGTSNLTSTAATLTVTGMEQVAGTLTGCGSADGTGPLAAFVSPMGVAIDGAGNMLVADTNNNTVRRVTPAGVVTTVAGLTGSAGAQDGSGAGARFNQPSSVAVDAAGTAYVADTGNHVIRRIDAGGVVSTLAGMAGVQGSNDGSGTSARFNSPSGIAVDSDGTVYVADTGNNTIRSISPTGVVSTVAGSGCFGWSDGPASSACFRQPSAVAVDSAKVIYVADTGSDIVRKISAGTVSTLAGDPVSHGSSDGTGSAALFYEPSGIAVDAAGNVYVADTWNELIRKITPAAVVTTLAGAPGQAGGDDGVGSAARFRGTHGLAVDANGNVIAADSTNCALRRIAPDGTVTTLAGSAPVRGSTDGAAMAAQFNVPMGLAVNASGDAFIVDEGGATVRKLTATGQVSTFAGSAGQHGLVDGMGSAARFESPYGIAADPAGNLFVTDQDGAIRKITPDGNVTHFAGGGFGSADGTGLAASFNNPLGIAADAQGNLYVADYVNNTIRKITPNAVVTTFAGAAGLSGSSDGTGTAARFNGPTDLAVDATGNVYVIDSGNSTVRRISPDGVVTTLAGAAGTWEAAVDGTGAAARFKAPSGIAVNAAGSLYVGDNYSIRKIDPNGNVTTIAGRTDVGIWLGDGPLSGVMRFVHAMAFDPHGFLLVTMANGVIRVAP